MIQAKRFSLKREFLPSSLYSDQPYCVGEWGLVVPQAVGEELREFFARFLAFCGRSERGIYFRMDAFLDPSMKFLKVIEINARFVDGWGTAMNLNRAAGHAVSLGGVGFPRLWHLPDNNRQYRREFTLARRELELAGLETKEVSGASLAKGEEVYYYGWDYPVRDNRTLVVPAWGYELENKLALVEFSEVWMGKLVQVPPCYAFPEWAWEDVLKAEVILKFVEKHSEDQRRGGASVLYARNITSRNEKFLRECYERRTLIAQELTEEVRVDGRMTQVIILSHGAVPVTGYLLLAPRGTRSINDSAEHGPLIFE